MPSPRTGRAVRQCRVAVACLALAGCGDAPPAALTNALEALQEDDTPDQADPDPSISDPLLVESELSSWSLCLERSRTAIDQAWRRHRQQIRSGGERRRRGHINLPALGPAALRSCVSLSDPTRSIPDALAADQEALKDAISAARDVATHTRRIDLYLDYHGYEADDWGLLRDVDPKLEEARARYDSARGHLEARIEELRAENDPQVLQKLEEQGRSKLELSSRALIVQARPLAGCLLREPSPTPGECEPRREGLSNASRSLKEALDTSTDSERVFWMRTFVPDLESFQEEVDRAFQGLGRARFDRRRLERAWAQLRHDGELLRWNFAESPQEGSD